MIGTAALVLNVAAEPLSHGTTSPNNLSPRGTKGGMLYGGEHEIPNLSTEAGQLHVEGTPVIVLADHYLEHERWGSSIMANESHIAILAQGVAAWNLWRAKHSEVRPNLRAAFLGGRDLSEADLSGADLSDARLEGSNLSSACLIRSNLRGARLCGVHANGGTHSVVILRKENFSAISLGGMSIAWTNLSKANLCGADLTDADLSGADLRKAHLSGAHLDNANLTWANLEGADFVRATLRKADLCESHLTDANFKEAHLEGSRLDGARLERTYLGAANLTGANLCRASLVGANVEGTIFNDCFVHGTAAWNLQGSPASQSSLVITRSFPPDNEPSLTIDDLEIAQFVYLILNNKKIRGVIDTITSRAVLILGRFTPPERKTVLEAVRDALREKGYVPILFDFTPSENRDLTETIQLLANLASFVVADLTDAKSIPQELSHIVPNLPSVPIQPIFLSTEGEYAMFEHWERYPWVLPPFRYQDQDDLISQFDEKVVAPIVNRRHRTSAESDLEVARRKIEELERQLATRPSLSK